MKLNRLSKKTTVFTRNLTLWGAWFPSPLSIPPDQGTVFRRRRRANGGDLAVDCTENWIFVIRTAEVGL